MNRITAAIEKIKKGLVHVPAAKLAELNTVLEMGIEEHALFQDKKSLAQANGTITYDEAVTIYGYLGESVFTFNKQPIEVKVVLTQLFKDLLSKAA